VRTRVDKYRPTQERALLRPST